MQGHWTTDEPPHDVLAAEAFAVPAPDPDLRHGPVVLPQDPLGIEEPHDVLAAEEFPMPAVSSQGTAWSALTRPADRSRLALWALAGALAALLLARVVRR